MKKSERTAQHVAQLKSLLMSAIQVEQAYRQALVSDDIRDSTGRRLLESVEYQRFIQRFISDVIDKVDV